MNLPMQTIFCVLYLLPLMLCDRLLDKMYISIEGSICFRRLNATHSTGCGSTLSGSVGVLHLVQSAADFSFVWNKPPAPPYTLIVPPWLFNRENILEIISRAKDNIAGIVLIENGTNFGNYSHELKCPNQYSGLNDRTCDANTTTIWNPFGTGLLHENFPFPIIYVKDKNKIQNLTDCYHKFNAFDQVNQHKRRLCSIEIKSFMSAAVNSAVCTRRTKYTNNMNPQRYCDPLQSKNVYATLFQRPAEDMQENVILVGARIDTTSMFDGIGLGAMDSLVPTVTLLSTAHTLSKILSDRDTGKYNVLFMLFNGEAYDYIGSQRFVYDLQNGAFPPSSNKSLKLSDIKLFIDISSLDSKNSTTIYQFSDFDLANEFVKLFNAKIEKYNFNIKVKRITTKNLPPASAQSFLRDNPKFPAVILYSDNDKNRFYHSIYDTEQNIGFVYLNTSRDFTTLVDLKENTIIIQPSFHLAIRNVSSSLSFSLYQLITGDSYTSDLAANPYLIDELLHCYLESAKCPLFQAVVKDPNMTIPPLPPQRYISVQNSLSYETVGWTYRVLGFLTGRPVSSATINNCTMLPLTWFAGFNGKGVCLRTTQNLSSALSPAFSIDNYEWNSGRYSTWTESTWSEINIRIFLKPAVSQEALTFVIGFGIMLISFILVFIVNSKSDILFGESTSSINVLTLPSQC